MAMVFVLAVAAAADDEVEVVTHKCSRHLRLLRSLALVLQDRTCSAGKSWIGTHCVATEVRGVRDPEPRVHLDLLPGCDVRIPGLRNMKVGGKVEWGAFFHILKGGWHGVGRHS